jgi:hypothetical protein
LGPNEVAPGVYTWCISKPNHCECDVRIVHWGLAFGGFSLGFLFFDVLSIEPGYFPSARLQKNGLKI